MLEVTIGSVRGTGSTGRHVGLVSIDVYWLAQATPSSSGDAPLSLTIALYSISVMFIVLGATYLTYLLRHKVERVERLLQGANQNKYVKHIQGPAAAVIVAAIRQSEFEQQWSPSFLPVNDRVKIRTALRRIQRESASLETADIARVSVILEKLLDEVLPALRAHRDRSLRLWLRDHPIASVAAVVWTVLKLTCVTAAIMPHLQHGGGRAIYVFAGSILVILLINAGLLDVLRRHSHYKYNALAEEVAASTSAGRIRRRITEHRLGLTGQSRPREGEDSQ